MNIIENPELLGRLNNLEKNQKAQQKFDSMVPPSMRPLFDLFKQKYANNQEFNPNTKDLNDIIMQLGRDPNPGRSVMDFFERYANIPDNAEPHVKEEMEEKAAAFYDLCRKYRGETEEQIRAGNLSKAEKLQRLNDEIFANAEARQAMENALGSDFNSLREEATKKGGQNAFEKTLDNLSQGFSNAAMHAWYDPGKRIGVLTFELLSMLAYCALALAEEGDIAANVHKTNGNQQSNPTLIPMKM